MRYDPLRRHRRSVRLRGYDYAAPGAYFVTVCAHSRECALGEIAAGGQMRLSGLGRAVETEWQALAGRFPHVRLDAYVIMPNHLHGVLIITDKGDGQRVVNQPRIEAAAAKPTGTRPGSLAAMVQNFKATSARRINALRGAPGNRVWQRNYWEHVVRDEADLARLRAYIRDNPARWAEDQLRPP